MRVRSDVDVQVHLLTSRVDVGQLAQLAFALGYDMHLTADNDDDSFRHRLVLRGPLAFTEERLPRLVYIQALASGRPVNDVIMRITRRFERWHVITDKPLDDLQASGRCTTADLVTTRNRKCATACAEASAIVR